MCVCVRGLFLMVFFVFVVCVRFFSNGRLYRQVVNPTGPRRTDEQLIQVDVNKVDGCDDHARNDHPGRH